MAKNFEGPEDENKSKNESLEKPVNKKEKRRERGADKQVIAEAEKLKGNIDELRDDVKNFGSQEELEKSLKENPGVAKRIMSRVYYIAIPILVFGGSAAIHEAFNSGDYGRLAATVFGIVASSVAVSSLIELFKKKKKPSAMDSENENEEFEDDE